MNGLVGRGSGGQGHNKRKQSALIGVFWDRRTSYKSKTGQFVVLKSELAAVTNNDYCMKKTSNKDTSIGQRFAKA